MYINTLSNAMLQDLLYGNEFCLENRTVVCFFFFGGGVNPYAVSIFDKHCTSRDSRISSAAISMYLQSMLRNIMNDFQGEL